MKVLVTGAFGNVGQSTLKALFGKGYDIRTFDIKTKINERTAKKLIKKMNFEIFWGDIRDKVSVEKAVKDVECIIHLAAIIPPLSEINPDFAYSVNVEGSRNLINAAKKRVPKPKFIFTSSVSVYGRQQNNPPPRKITDELKPIEKYGEHKIIIEKELKSSGLPWTIFRLGAVTAFYNPWKIPDILFEIPLEQRIEIVHTLDVGRACANAIETPTEGKILHIGGGKRCQMYQRDYISQMLEAMGIGMLPDVAFKAPKREEDWYHVDWMDTEEAQRLLKYQQLTLNDFIKELKRKTIFQRGLIWLLKPIVRLWLLNKSKYYRKYKKLQRKEKAKITALTISAKH